MLHFTGKSKIHIFLPQKTFPLLAHFILNDTIYTNKQKDETFYLTLL